MKWILIPVLMVSSLSLMEAHAGECWTRYYENSHLSQNPGQLVRVIEAWVYADESSRTPVVDLKVGTTEVQATAVDYRTRGRCTGRAGQLTCEGEDVGSFRFEKRQDGTARLILTSNLVFADADPEDGYADRLVLPNNVANRTFRLERSPESDCQSLQ